MRNSGAPHHEQNWVSQSQVLLPCHLPTPCSLPRISLHHVWPLLEGSYAHHCTTNAPPLVSFEGGWTPWPWAHSWTISSQSSRFLQSGLWAFSLCPLPRGQLSAITGTTSAVTEAQQLSSLTDSLSQCLLAASYLPEPALD